MAVKMRRSTREEEMTEALLDIANEFNFAPDDDITEDIEPVYQEASMFDAMFEELQPKFWFGFHMFSKICNKSWR